MIRAKVGAKACLAILAVSFFAFSGCTGSDTPDQKIARISKTIKLATGPATALGLTAVPDTAEADAIALKTIEVMDSTVWPILNGDEAGLAAAIEQLRDLSVFDDPKLEKLKLILDKVMPLLEANLPDDLIDQGLGKVPADVKAYMTAFFAGVYNGAKSYMGDTDGLRGGQEWMELRQKLAAK